MFDSDIKYRAGETNISAGLSWHPQEPIMDNVEAIRIDEHVANLINRVEMSDQEAIKTAHLHSKILSVKLTLLGSYMVPL